MPRDGMFDQAGKICTEVGQVVPDESDGITIGMTPDAAGEKDEGAAAQRPLYVDRHQSTTCLNQPIPMLIADAPALKGE